MLKKFNKNLGEFLNTFEYIMKIGAFALLEQMLHFPKYFQIHVPINHAYHTFSLLLLLLFFVFYRLPLPAFQVPGIHGTVI